MIIQFFHYNKIRIKQISNIMNQTTILSSFRKAGNQVKSPPRKITNPFTQVIFEDDKLFHHIKIKGKSAQINNDKIICKSRTKSISCQTNQINNNQVQNYRKQNIKRVYRSLPITNKKIQRGTQKNIKRSVTAQSVEIMKMFCLQKKFSQKISKTEYNGFQSTVHDKPRLCYQKQNLNEQVYCNFKLMLDQFNKVKKKTKQKNQLPQTKSIKESYRKPSFYEYQSFYRQNYRAKQVKQTILLFNKCQTNKPKQQIINNTTLDENLLSISNKKYQPDISTNNNQTNKNASPQKKTISNQASSCNKYKIPKNKIECQQTYKFVNFDNIQCPLKIQSPILKKQSLFPSYLQIKSHSLTKTERAEQIKKKLSYFNKTYRCNTEIKQTKKQHEEVSPWIINQLDNCNF